MLDIIICDDHSHVVRKLESFIGAYLVEKKDRGIELALMTTDPTQVLEYLGIHDLDDDGNNTYVQRDRLFFLDVDFDGKVPYTGVDLAREIRKHDPTSEIVFLSSTSKRASETAKQILPLDFLTKGVLLDSVRDEILRLVEQAYGRIFTRTPHGHAISIKTSSKNMLFYNLNDILYIEGGAKGSSNDTKSLNTPAKLYTTKDKETTELKKPLKFYEETIPQLLRVGRSQLINPFHVASIRKSGRSAYIVLSTGTEFKIMRNTVEQYERAIIALRNAEQTKNSNTNS